MQIFWIIFNLSGNPERESKPAYKLKQYTDEQKALAELERLSKFYTGQKYVLMETVGYADKDGVKNAKI